MDWEAPYPSLFLLFPKLPLCQHIADCQHLAVAEKEQRCAYRFHPFAISPDRFTYPSCQRAWISYLLGAVLEETLIFLLKVLHQRVKESCTTHTDFLRNVLYFSWLFLNLRFCTFVWDSCPSLQLVCAHRAIPARLRETSLGFFKSRSPAQDWGSESQISRTSDWECAVWSTRMLDSNLENTRQKSGSCEVNQTR